MTWDGRPPNPEVEGWHWLQQLGELFPVQWNASRQQWGGMARWTAEEMFWSTYIGPASPDDARELAKMKEALRHLGELSKADHDRLQTELARLREGIERLGSMEAFTVTRAVTNSEADQELSARIDYARALLKGPTP